MPAMAGPITCTTVQIKAELVIEHFVFCRLGQDKDRQDSRAVCLRQLQPGAC